MTSAATLLLYAALGLSTVALAIAVSVAADMLKSGCGWWR